MQAHKSGNDEHLRLLFDEMQARIERGTKFGSENESAAGQYVRGEPIYQPYGNRSISFEESNINQTVDIKEKANNVEFDTAVWQTTISKPFSACFCTFDGDEDDLIS